MDHVIPAYHRVISCLTLALAKDALPIRPMSAFGTSVLTIHGHFGTYTIAGVLISPSPSDHISRGQ